MCDKFNGFSQDEINRVSGIKNKKLATVDTMKPVSFRGHSGIRRMVDKSESARQQKNSQTKQPHQQVSHKVHFEKSNNVTNKISENPKFQLDADLDDLSLDRSMSKSLEEALYFQPLKSRRQPQQKSDNVAVSTGHARLHNPAQQNGKSEINAQSSIEDSIILKDGINNKVSSSFCTDNPDDSSILSSILPSLPNDDDKERALSVAISSKVDSPFKGISLKDFESHRKMIEEQNRQKKELLYKAIEQHSQKTAAEARKIEDIKAELSKLDNDLALDVALLRKQIDNACIHFATVEKQYMKIESQFLKAKMDLHNAAEKKELLTEHLCTVIAHNEDRKAQKLTELMEKVGLPTNSGYELPTSSK